jgi:hypothetical protein
MSQPPADDEEDVPLFPDLPYQDAPRPPAIVYVVTESDLNLVRATRFGELQWLLPAKTNIVMNPTSIIKGLKQRLKTFTDHDFILPVGDPIAIGLAFTVAASVNDGRFKALKWDREVGDYYVVSCSLRGR